MSVERPDRSRPRDPRTGADAVRARVEQQGTWVDLQVSQAVSRGDFDDLPGYGKPLENLTGEHDPDWWVKRLIEREQITGVLPPSLQVRKEDLTLDARLDRLATAEQVRQEVDDFNALVRWALYRPPEGPPVVTSQRDPDEEVARWQDRRRNRATRAGGDDPQVGTAASGPRSPGPHRGRGRWRRSR